MNELPKQVEVGDSAYLPAIPFGVRGSAAPGAGGGDLSVAANAAPPSVPAIDPFTPGITSALSVCCLPEMQSIVPVRR